jgi:VCBS repeat-containing protein
MSLFFLLERVNHPQTFLKKLQTTSFSSMAELQGLQKAHELLTAGHNTTSVSAYAWKRNGSPDVALQPTNEVGNAYRLVSADVGSTISCTMTTPEGSVTVTTGIIASSITIKAGATISVAENTQTVIANLLTGSHASDNVTYTIGGANNLFEMSGNALQFKTAPDYENFNYTDKTVTVDVTASDNGSANAATSTFTVQVTNAAEAASGSVTIDGTPKVGYTLTADITSVTHADELDNTAPATYEWKRGSDIIDGETSATYDLISADAGSTITCTVTYTRADTNLNPTTYSISSAPTAIAANASLAGTETAHETLSVTATDGDENFPTYAWKRNGINGSPDVMLGATTNTYTLVSADVGSTISCTITYSTGATETVTTGTIASSITMVDNTSTIEVEENSTDAVIVNVLDSSHADDGTVTYAVAGTNGNLFEMNGAALQFKTAPDYETFDYTNKTVMVNVTATAAGSTTNKVTTTYTVQVTNKAPVHGAITDGTIVENDQASTTTDNNLSGTFTVTVDTTATVTFGIDNGTAVPDDGTVTKAGTYGTLTVTTSSGDYTYTKTDSAIEALDATESGTDTFTITVTDGTATVPATYEVTVTGADDAPTLTALTNGTISETANSSATTHANITGTLSAADVDVETLTYGIDGGSAGTAANTVTKAGTYGTLTVTTSSGAYTYTKNASAIEALDDGESGTDTFTFTVSDGDGANVIKPFKVTVTGANDKPVHGNITNGTIVENDQASTTTDNNLSGTFSASDVDVETLTFGISGGTDVPDGTVKKEETYGTLTVTTSSGAYIYTKTDSAIEALDATESGTDSFTITVTDGTATVNATYEVTVTGADDAPTLTALTNGTVSETVNLSTTTHANITGTLSAADVDDETLTYGIDGGTSSFLHVTKAGTYGTLSVHTSNGDYIYTKNASAIEALKAGEEQTDSFTFTVSDGDGDKVTKPFKVTVTGANDTPTYVNTLTNQTGAVEKLTEGQSKTYTFAENTFGDVDKDKAFTYTALFSDDNKSTWNTTLPSWITFTAGERKFVFTPTNDNQTEALDTYYIKVTAADVHGSTAEGTFQVDVQAVDTDQLTVKIVHKPERLSVGDVLEAVYDLDSDADRKNTSPNISYQWSVDKDTGSSWEEISENGTSKTFEIPAEYQTDYKVKVQVTYTDKQKFTKTVESTSTTATSKSFITVQPLSEDGRKSKAADAVAKGSVQVDLQMQNVSIENISEGDEKKRAIFTKKKLVSEIAKIDTEQITEDDYLGGKSLRNGLSISGFKAPEKTLAEAIDAAKESKKGTVHLMTEDGDVAVINTESRIAGKKVDSSFGSVKVEVSNVTEEGGMDLTITWEDETKTFSITDSEASKLMSMKAKKQRQRILKLFDSGSLIDGGSLLLTEPISTQLTSNMAGGVQFSFSIDNTTGLPVALSYTIAPNDAGTVIFNPAGPITDQSTVVSAMHIPLDFDGSTITVTATVTHPDTNETASLSFDVVVLPYESGASADPFITPYF